MFTSHRQFAEMLAAPPPPDTVPTLQRLLYTSRLAPRFEPYERAALARKIGARAAETNRACGLTGCLLLVDDCFIQVIEGLPQHVERVFEAICCDFRHREVRLIDLAQGHERLFPQWGMACLAQDGETTVDLVDDMAEIRFLAGVNAREALRQMQALFQRTQG